MRTFRVLLLLALGIAAGCAGRHAFLEPTTTPAPPPEIAYEARVVGWSAEGRPIHAHAYGTGPRVSLLVSGLHGDAPSGPFVLRRFAARLAAHPAELAGRRVVVLPIANPDGRVRSSRGNARGVDLDRNFPAGNWRPHARCGRAPESEPETAAVIQAIHHYRPWRVLHVRSPLHRITYRGRAAAALAGQMSRAGPYPFVPFGPPLPSGALGVFTGVDLGLPTVVLDLDAREPSERLWRDAEAVLAAFLVGDESNGDGPAARVGAPAGSGAGRAAAGHSPAGGTLRPVVAAPPGGARLAGRPRRGGRECRGGAGGRQARGWNFRCTSCSRSSSTCV